MNARSDTSDTAHESYSYRYLAMAIAIRPIRASTDLSFWVVELATWLALTRFEQVRSLSFTSTEHFLHRMVCWSDEVSFPSKSLLANCHIRLVSEFIAHAATHSSSSI